MEGDKDVPPRRITIMFRIRLLNRISRHGRDSIEENSALFPTHSANASIGMCQPSDNDLSYEDALVDTQARLFFRSELGDTDPADPSRTLKALMARIEKERNFAGEEIKSIPAGPVSAPVPVSGVVNGFLSSARRAISGALVSRIVPGGVALVLLLSVLGADIAQVLRTEPYRGLFVTAELESQTPFPSNPGPQDPTDTSVFVAGPLSPLMDVPSRAALLHPVELGMKPNQRELWVRAFPEYFEYYGDTMSGPQ
jgi:hypothetical protein